MQDMETLQQHCVTSPTPASTVQAQDSSFDSVSNSTSDEEAQHQETSRTDTENDDHNSNAMTNSHNEPDKKKCNEPCSDSTSQPKNNEDSSETREGDSKERVKEAQESVLYVCPICDTLLSSQHDFTLHIRSHNNDSTEPSVSPLSCAKGYSCRICGKVLSSSSSLDRHVLVHSGERPFKCRICGVAFTTNGNMHRHMRTHTTSSSGGSPHYESDGSTESCGSQSPPSGVVKKRRVAAEPNNNSRSPGESHKRKAADMMSEGDEDLGRRKMKPIENNLEHTPPPQCHHCPVCDRDDFISPHVLETHLEERHPDYKVACNTCSLQFKNHRVLNLHRIMVHQDEALRGKYGPSVLGFTDLTFVDFSSHKFPHIARAVCEQSLHKASSVYHRFQCDRCARAFPCGSALNIHRPSCVARRSEHCDTPTDLSSRRTWFRKSSESADSEEEQKREHFFAGLDLKNKSVPPEMMSELLLRHEDKYDNDSYFNAVRESGKEDLADIQSIISVTSAGGLLQDLSKSPQPHAVTELTPPDSGLRGGGDHGVGDEEQQDCFAAEFRKMKVKGEFPCRLCTAVFPNLRALKGHNRSHLSASAGLYRCNMCPYSNADKAVLVRHMRTHNGDRPYECALCNYAFTTKANCERHLRNRHSKLSREEVKKSIIYHPSEDPTNDPELQAKLGSKEEVKRSLVFNSQRSSLEDLNNSDHYSSDYHKDAIQMKIPQELSKVLVEEETHPDKQVAHDTERPRRPRVMASPPTVCTKPERSAAVQKIRPWEPREGSTNTRQVEEDMQDDASYDETSDAEEHDKKISSIQALVNFTKNNNNNNNNRNNNNDHNFNKFSYQDQRSNNKESADNSLSGGRYMESPYARESAASPLDLSMDALDLSKKKEGHSLPVSVNNLDEPQDLSTKSATTHSSSEFNNNKKAAVFTSTEKSPTSHSALPQHILNLNNRSGTSPQSLSPNTITTMEVNQAAFYSANPHLNHLYLNNNSFPFQSQAAFPLHPYFMPPPPLFTGANVQDFAEMKERLQKELIRGLQLTSGGSLLDPMTMVNWMAARSKVDMKVNFEGGPASVNTEEPKKLVPISVKEVTEIASSVNKVVEVHKALASPKPNRDRESSSVKMVIKNGVLMPKQKQRRYRTERPFACEHCSARFTLRSNMERHIKQQHPQHWSQRQRGNIGGPGAGRRQPPSAPVLQPSETFNHRPPTPETPESSVHEAPDYKQPPAKVECITPKIEDEGSPMEESLEDMNKTKEISSVIINNNVNNNNKTFISDQVKFAIAQQLKSKLNQPGPLKSEEDNNNIEDEMDEEDELVIDEENEGEDEEGVEERQQPGKDEGVDLASVSKLLDNATTQTFRQYFRGSQDGEEAEYHRGEGSEEDEEGLVAGSNSEGNNSGSDENRSESEMNSTAGKKKSAYSLAPNRVSCPYCFRKFPWSSSLRRHVLTHTGQKPYKCPHCPLLFTTKSNCDRHLLRKHGGPPAPPASSSSDTSPGSNSYTMRNVPERPYKCNHCPSSTFSTQSNLRKHVATKHGRGETSSPSRGSPPAEDPYNAVENCGEESGSEDVEAPQPEPATSEVSDKEEPRALEAKPPQEPHGVSSDLPFKCHLCDSSYPERSEALDHIKEHHGSEFELLMSKGALESAVTEDNNNLHGSVTQDDGAPGEENLEQLRGKFPDYANRKVMCAFCLRRFWSAEDLRRHMRTHTGERPFSCDICRRRFTLKHSMLRHRKKHNSGTLYPGPPAEEEEDVPAPTTNHNNNTIPAAKDPRYWQGDSDDLAAARILSSKFSGEAKDEGEEDTDLIGNLLGIRDRSIIDKVLLSKSADDAAKLLGVNNGAHD